MYVRTYVHTKKEKEGISSHKSLYHPPKTLNLEPLTLHFREKRESLSEKPIGLIDLFVFLGAGLFSIHMYKRLLIRDRGTGVEMEIARFGSLSMYTYVCILQSGWTKPAITVGNGKGKKEKPTLSQLSNPPGNTFHRFGGNFCSQFQVNPDKKKKSLLK
jgi:hypothetical protein